MCQPSFLRPQHTVHACHVSSAAWWVNLNIHYSVCCSGTGRYVLHLARQFKYMQNGTDRQTDGHGTDSLLLSMSTMPMHNLFRTAFFPVICCHVPYHKVEMQKWLKTLV